jgi:uncharacterized membrane protein YwzB
MKDEPVKATAHRGRRQQLLIAVVLGIILAVVLGTISFLATAAGHGTYVPVALFFPAPLLLAVKLAEFSNAVLCLAAAQWPLYAVAIELGARRGRQKAAMICLVLVHATLIAACFLFDRHGQYLSSSIFAFPR